MTDPYAEGAHARITSALDPAPALGWKAMQTAAAEKIKAHSNTARLKMRVAHEAEDTDDYDGWSAIVAHLDIAHDAILAITGPTADQLLEEAVKLEAVRELVRAAKWIGVVAQTTSGTAGPDIDLIEAIDVLANAIAKIETVRGQGYRLSEALSAHVHPSTRNKAAGTPWSPKEDKILREMKTSWSELWTIAEELERSEQAIIERLRILEC